jgi:hypothetical protein
VVGERCSAAVTRTLPTEFLLETAKDFLKALSTFVNGLDTGSSKCGVTATEVFSALTKDDDLES